jgi:hypothetical protein
MNLPGRYSYLKLLSVQYKRASKRRKGIILDEVVKNLGYSRKHAIVLVGSIHKKDLRKKSVGQRAKISSYVPIVKPLKELWMNYLEASFEVSGKIE